MPTPDGSNSPTRVAVVTGAGSGIGRAVALGFLNDGWKVVVAGRRADRLNETIEQAGPAGSQALAVPTDVTDPASVAFVNESELLAAAADAEAMYREVILPQKLRMYLDYIAHQSVAGDLKVLVRTVVAALRN